MSPDFKRCTVCGVTKASSEFYRNTTRSGGLQSACKPCQVVRNRESRLRNPEPNRESRRRAYERNREAERARRRAWRDENRDKYLAHKAVENALTAGRLVRPEKCERCGGDGSLIHAHHEDYSCRLDVQWLCAPCHGQRHLEIAA